MSKTDASQPAGDESVLSLRSFTKPVTGLANKMSDWLGHNPAVVLLLCILVAISWGGYRMALWVAYDVVPAHDKRIIEGMRSLQDQNLEAIKQMRADSTRDIRYAVDAFTKERDRDRERDKEREQMLRELKDWLKESHKAGKTNTSTVARPAG